jgi:hypothetical protein
MSLHKRYLVMSEEKHIGGHVEQQNILTATYQILINPKKGMQNFIRPELVQYTVYF